MASTIIRISEGVCWSCGEKTANTTHHGLPQHLSPVKNVLIPICKDCHAEINAGDVRGMYSFINKIVRTSKEANRGIYELKKLLNEHCKKLESGELIIEDTLRGLDCLQCKGTGKLEEDNCQMCQGRGYFKKSGDDINGPDNP